MKFSVLLCVFTFVVQIALAANFVKDFVQNLLDESDGKTKGEHDENIFEFYSSKFDENVYDGNGDDVNFDSELCAKDMLFAFKFAVLSENISKMRIKDVIIGNQDEYSVLVSNTQVNSLEHVDISEDTKWIFNSTENLAAVKVHFHYPILKFRSHFAILEKENEIFSDDVMTTVKHLMFNVEISTFPLGYDSYKVKALFLEPLFNGHSEVTFNRTHDEDDEFLDAITSVMKVTFMEFATNYVLSALVDAFGSYFSVIELNEYIEA